LLIRKVLMAVVDFRDVVQSTWHPIASSSAEVPDAEVGLMANHKERPYQVIATTLHPSDIVEADRIAEMLKSEGWPRATRSMVLREAMALLREDLQDKTPDEVFRYFIEHRGRRMGSRPR
jgi:hypothetical protein